MRIIGRPSWRFSHDVGDDALDFVLYVREAAGLPVAADLDTPPTLIADVPVHAGLVPPAEQDRVGERWSRWFDDVAGWAGASHLTGRPTAADQRELLRTIEAAHGQHVDPPDWLRDRAAERRRHVDPPDWATLADCPPLQDAARALRQEFDRWHAPVREQYRQKPLRETLFPWARVRDRAEHAAAVHHVSVGDVDGAAQVLAVHGVWWRLVAPGAVVCSVDAAAEAEASVAILDAVFDSHLAG